MDPESSPRIEGQQTRKAFGEDAFFGTYDANYVHILKSKNNLIDLLNKTIDNVKKELIHSRDRINELEQELNEYRTTASNSINRRQFGFYYYTVTDKQLDEQTWNLFKETFKFTYERQLNDEVYEWIKKIEPSVE